MSFKHPSSLFPSLVMAFLLPLTLQAFQGDSMEIVSSGLHTGSVRRGCYQNVEQRRAYCSSRGLDSVLQNLAEDTNELDLSENNITVLPKFSFRRYPLITDLDLSANDIRVIEPTAFHPLKKLVNLSIIANRNLVLPVSGLFRWASKLTLLNLSGSNLKSLPNDTLKWNQHIDYLDLGFNHLTFINISTCGSVRYAGFAYNHIEQLTKETFTFGCQTDHLELGNNPIKLIDPIAIAALHTHSLILIYAGGHSWTPEMLRNLTIGISRSHIKSLKVDVNLGHFPQDVFTPLRDYSFTLLDFSYNKVNALFPFVFSNLTLLDQLDLSNNKIATIEPNFFDSMQALKVLNINFNQVRSINTGNHTWTINLIKLYLSTNSLTEISKFAFLGLQNLTLLDLSFNRRLASIYLTSFTGLDNIHTIDLSGCSIRYLQLYTPVLRSLYMKRNYLFGAPINPLEPGKSFKDSTNLVYLDIQESQVFPYNLWDPATNVSLFEGLFNLTTLDMSKNPNIGKFGLDLGIFHHLSALQELSLDACAISNLHPLVFTGLDSLQKLNLSGNNLEQIRIGLLTGLGQIRSIKLDGNILALLDERTFLNKSRLTSLSLANNKLTFLNESIFRPIYTSLSLVDFSQNPLICTCDLEWLLHWLNQNGTVRLANENQTLCAPSSLASLREKPLLHFNPSELCRFNYAIFSLIPIVIVSLVVLLALVYHQRWRLRYKLFLLKLAVIGYRGEAIDARDHNDYEFDVNIIFYDDDEEWIRDNLRPTLEVQLPQFQRNTFGDADLIPGMYYLDAVDYVVSRSYKTIILLSRAAVRDRWFMLKFRTAMNHVSDTQTEFVVVVFLEDIPDDEIPFLARLFLSDGRPYLHWTEDVRGQEYFWNELAKNLTINLRTNDLIPNE
ncbi:toll-like receptor Tlr1.1 precursor [Strongylocentrotus purpuratus]|uniref:Toll-like receptor Tlr1.1 n=1 Tax=Strongylocentrotus purpuratus TaxID=7668 RepID=Q9BJD6_STRPU|nr:toll-like receptor Tlr1.1 precursor [Strongylocentrotus purpuratus]AAK25761.1 toll-like receptor Tlr1.1 [Strongylocentrotus purpuratus]|eukprot:NP_999670.1 toll-like receptor Tlr1.1 precursor [Strongylocentrotus purpuratus]